MNMFFFVVVCEQNGINRSLVILSVLTKNKQGCKCRVAQKQIFVVMLLCLLNDFADSKEI